MRTRRIPEPLSEPIERGAAVDDQTIDQLPGNDAVAADPPNDQAAADTTPQPPKLMLYFETTGLSDSFVGFKFMGQQSGRNNPVYPAYQDAMPGRVDCPIVEAVAEFITTNRAGLKAKRLKDELATNRQVIKDKESSLPQLRDDYTAAIADAQTDIANELQRKISESEADIANFKSLCESLEIAHRAAYVPAMNELRQAALKAHQQMREEATAEAAALIQEISDFIGDRLPRLFIADAAAKWMTNDMEQYFRRAGIVAE